MIRKDLDEIDPDDLGSLCETQRAEDERLEFKQSFKGGESLRAMTDPQRDKALESLAKEAIAFVNHDGGDIVIGVVEDDQGVAVGLNQVQEVSDAAERIRRSLQKRIEPSPHSIRVRGVASGDEAQGLGYLIIRCEPSLRAPHRLVRTKEFYVRRGTEASPMDISEVHDLTLSSRSNSERVLGMLHDELLNLHEKTANNRPIGTPGLHARAVFLPLQLTQITLETNNLAVLLNGAPRFYVGANEEKNDVAFRNVGANWRPVLRGKIVENWEPGEVDDLGRYSAKRVQADGSIIFDWYARYYPANLNAPAIHFEWYQGFLAEICNGLIALQGNEPQLGAGLLGLAIRTEPYQGNLAHLITGSRMFQEHFPFPALERVHELPPAVIRENKDFDTFFQQAQTDLLNICSTELDVATLFAPADEVEEG